MHKRAQCRRAVSVRPSVWVFVMFVYSVEMSKHILKLFSPYGRATILVFPSRTLWQYSDGNALTVAKKSQFWPLSGFGIDHCWTVECHQHFDGGVRLELNGGVFHRWRRTTQRHASVNLVYDCKPRRYAEDIRTQFNLYTLVKSEAEVTNNKRLRSRYCNSYVYWQTRSIARYLCQSSFLLL